MSLKETSNKLEKIKLEKETKEAILSLIDDKTNQDMKEIIAEMKGLRGELNTSIGSLNSKIDSSIGSLKDGILSNRSENKFTQWLVIALFTVVSIAIAVGVFNFKK